MQNRKPTDGQLDKIVSQAVEYHPAKSRLHTAIDVIKLHELYCLQPKDMLEYLRYKYDCREHVLDLPQWCEQNMVKYRR